MQVAAANHKSILLYILTVRANNPENIPPTTTKHLLLKSSLESVSRRKRKLMIVWVFMAKHCKVLSPIVFCVYSFTNLLGTPINLT